MSGHDTSPPPAPGDVGSDNTIPTVPESEGPTQPSDGSDPPGATTEQFVGPDEADVAAATVVPDTEPPPEPSGPSLGDLGDALGELTVAVERIRARAEKDQDIISRMQQRIDELQGNQSRALMGPVVTELAKLHAAVLESAELDYERLGVDRVRKELALTADRVIDAMDLVGVTLIEAEPGEPFDARQHNAVRRVATTDPALDGVIAEVLRQGFRFEGEPKPALHARVKVYVFDAEPPADPQANVPTSDHFVHFHN